MGKRSLIVPANSHQYFYVGSADMFVKALQESTSSESSDFKIEPSQDMLDFLVTEKDKKNEIRLTRRLSDASNRNIGPIIRCKVFRPDSGIDFVRVNFEPNPNLNKVLYSAPVIACTLYLCADVFKVWPQLGISVGNNFGIAVMVYIFWSRIVIAYMKSKFPPDPLLVAHVKQIAERTKAESEEKLLTDGS